MHRKCVKEKGTREATLINVLLPLSTRKAGADLFLLHKALFLKEFSAQISKQEIISFLHVKKEAKKKK